MKFRNFAICSMFVLALSVWVMPAAAQMTDSDKTRVYVSVIDSLIQNCESKSAMADTASDNLRDDVRIALMKASFYKKNKEVLVEEMAQNNIEPESYKVQHFLNERFFAIVRDNDPKVAEAYSEPDDVRIPVSK